LGYSVEMDTYALAAYLSLVLATVAPHVGSARRGSIARDVAVVSLAEPRAFDDDADGHKTALLLLSLADHESHFATWVDDGSCNDPAWRAEHPALLAGKDCDGGHAFTIFQLHVLGDSVELGRALIRDRRAAARAALAVARASLESGRGLCGYVGEAYPKCPRAQVRWDSAVAWQEQFPFPVATADAGP
jgi:hypothetical protein